MFLQQIGTQSKAVQAFAKRHRQPATKTRTALDSLSSALRKGLLMDGSEISSEDDLLKINSSNDANSEEEKSDASIPLPKRTGNFDADISPTPKVPKSLHGFKVKRSKSASTSGVAIKEHMKEGNDTDTSDVNVPCSGTVSGIHLRTKKTFYHYQPNV